LGSPRATETQREGEWLITVGQFSLPSLPDQARFILSFSSLSVTLWLRERIH